MRSGIACADIIPGEDTMTLRTITAALLALALSAGAAAAQPATSLKDQIVGSWNFVVAEVTAPDGKKSFPFGETRKGILISPPTAASPRSTSPATCPKSHPTTA
jgi:hypothetical protein